MQHEAEPRCALRGDEGILVDIRRGRTRPNVPVADAELKTRHRTMWGSVTMR